MKEDMLHVGHVEKEFEERVIAEQLHYWQKNLDGIPDLTHLPFTKNRLANPTFITHFHSFDLSQNMRDKLIKLSVQKNVSMETIFLSALTLLLFRYSNKNDIVVGIPLSKKSDQIGLDVNYIAIRALFDHLENFDDLLFFIHDTCKNGRENQDVPFKVLLEKLNIKRVPKRHPIFQVALHVTDESSQINTDSVAIGKIHPKFLKNDFDLSLTITDETQTFKVSIGYAFDLFDQAFGMRFEGHLINVLEAFCAIPEFSIRTLNYLDPKEQTQILVDWNKTNTHFPLDKTIHQLFEEQVERTPDAIALIFDDLRLTYHELNKKSNQLAHFLINEHKIRFDTPIVLCLERSEQMLITILAILKAGGAYVPIDPEIPLERIQYILEDTKTSIVITQEAYCNHFDQLNCIFIDGQTTQAKLSKEHSSNPELSIKSHHLAYVLYTSGTTGRPKGVMIEHQGIVNRLFWKNSVFPIQPEDKFLQKSPYVFDVSVIELFWPHWFGGSIVVARPGGHRDPDYIKNLIEKESITIIHFVPSMLEVFLDTIVEAKTQFSSLRLVVCSGEALQIKTVKHFYEKLENIDLYNLYGPTEASVDVLKYDCKDIQSNEVYIGKPIANTQAYILDDNKIPLPIGVVGELYIGGVQLARGYLNRPELTAEKFIPCSLAPQNKLYKTGDLVKWMPDGNIAYIGRNDNQVKIRGYRIELDEISAALSNHPEVKQAIVDIKEYGGSKRLVAYCVKELELDKSDEKDFVNTWGSLFDSEYESIDGRDIHLNIQGWKSSYTGLSISSEQMQEWTQETVKRIQALKPKAILEIGSGSGLILFNIIDSCEKYYATDISKNVIDYTDKIVHQYHLQDKVTTACCFADEIPYERFDQLYDTVVINSVIQLFPNLDYLEEVILESMTHMRDRGQIFIGDVRDYRLLHSFHYSVLTYKNGEATKAEVDHFVRREKELLILPEYFANLQATIPFISHVEIMQKMGHADHEMNRFRYDVILHVDKNIHVDNERGIASIEPSDFVRVEELPSYLESHEEEIICIKYLNERILKDYTGYHNLKIEVNQKLLGVNSISEEAKRKGYQSKFYLDINNPLYVDIVLYRNKEFKINFTSRSQRSDFANNPLFTSKLVENTFAQKLKDYLNTKLPEFMIPEQYVLLDSLPITSNGKLDKKALPEVGFISNGEYVAPRNELEAQIHAIWADILGLPGEKVSIIDDFFRLGGNSILAIKLANQLSKNLQQNVKVADIFTYTSIEKLVESLSSTKQKKIGIGKGVFSNQKDQVLSFAQERLWFIQTYENGTNAYNIPMVYQLSKEADSNIIKQSLIRIVERHEILRTLIKEDSEGNGYQQILDCHAFHIQEIKIEADQLDDELNKEINHIFDLSEEIPVRIRLCSVSDGRRMLCIVIHHIAFDGWSLDVFLNELEAHYAYYTGKISTQLPELNFQYKDFAQWQRNYLQEEKLEKQMSYWKTKLEGCEALNLITDKPRLQEIDYNGSDVFFSFDEHLSLQLRALAQELNVSLYSLLLSAYYLMLRVYSNQNNIILGTPIANRHYNDIDEMIGFFVNSLVLSYQISSNMTLENTIKEVANEVVKAQLHQDLPFEKLVAELDIIKDKSRHPLFQVMFTVQNFGGKLEKSTVYRSDRTHDHLSSIMEPYDRELRLFQVAYFDITTFIDDSKEKLEGRFNYATALFHRETISQYIITFEHILRQFVNSNCRKTKIAELSYINEQDYDCIINNWNQTTTAYPDKMKVHQLFEYYVTTTPDAIAIVRDELTLTYKELNQKANRLAHYLVKDCHLQPEDLIGICLEDNLEMIIASLGIFKAGGAYVPMDSRLPDERLHHILADADFSIVITNIQNSQRLGISEWISIDSEDVKKHSDLNLEIKNPQKSIAQVLYTSGTTGHPKGVMIEHHNIVSLVKNTNFITIDSSDTFIQLADTSFDASTLEIWGPLLNGGSLVLVKNKMDLFTNSQLFQKMLEKHRITILWLTRALFDQIYIENKKTFRSLKALIIGGEALTKKLVEELVTSEYVPEHLINGYGPTECTTFSCTLEITKEALQYAKTIPIGKPIANKSAYVLNEEKSPLPIGAVGELYIGGSGCARGYLNNHELTTKKFIPNPFSKAKNEMLYKTGDLVRWLPNGNLEFIGRNDFQVKINGYRIELEEIESVLSQHNEIKQVAVLIKEHKENKSLVAYCVKSLELDENDTQEFVNIWETLYQSEYDSLTPENFKLNIKGWNSSYTKQPIPAKEMLEWIQQTVKRIAEQKPRRILEIGSGSGLILFNIYDKCDHYIATDFSQSVIAYTDKIIESHGLKSKIDTICCPADQIPYSTLEKGYDTVVINSVTQYFPHLDYLESVLLEAIAHMDDSGRLFIGDIRDYRLLECFHYSVLRYKGEETTKAEVAHFVRREKELLISPEYFIYLKMMNPEIASVEIMPKKGCADHEMNNYRYDVILHIDKKCSTQIDAKFKDVETSEFVQVDDIADAIETLVEQENLLVKYPNKRIFKDYASYYVLKINKNQQLLGIDDITKLARGRGYEAQFILNLSSPLYLNIAFYKSKKIRINYITQVNRQELANNPLVTSKLVENQFTQKLKEHLSAKLPEYMIPEHYVVMDKFPVTQNGKLNRNALPEVGFTGNDNHIPPRNELEKQVHTIWADVLGLSEDKVSITDNFFRLGGNSILAIKLANKLNQSLQKNIKVSDIFTYPSVEKLVQNFIGNQSGNISIEKGHFVNHKDQVLSFAQERLWFIQTYEHGTNVYNVPLTFKLSNQINLEALKKSLSCIIHRHEILRTLIKEDEEGNGYQVILETNELQIPLIKVSQSQLDNELDKEVNHAFDLKEEIPTRICFYEVPKVSYFLSIVFHHVAFDGWSLDLFLKELDVYYAFYSGASTKTLPDRKLQYKDFAKWQRDYLIGGQLKEQLKYWQSKLVNYETLNLVTDRVRPKKIDYSGSNVFFKFDRVLSQKLRQLAQKLGVSLYSLLLSAYYLLLKTYSSQNDILLGSPIANRHYSHIEDMIGFFVNSLVFRSSIKLELKIDEFIRQTSSEVIDVQRNQDVPFEKLVEEFELCKDTTRHPLFQVMFTVQSFGSQLEDQLYRLRELEDISIAKVIQPYDRNLQLFQVAYFDLTTFIDDSKEELEGRFNYATALFDHQTIEGYVATYKHILHQFVELDCSQAHLSDVTLINQTEHNHIINNWNQTFAAYPDKMQIQQLFEYYSTQTPDAIAIIRDEQTVSYEKLNKKANQLAHYLVNECHLQREDLIGIYLEDNLDMIIASLAILKAGGAYVPMDSRLPDDRLHHILGDARFSVVITHAANSQRLGISKWISVDSEKLKNQPETNPEIEGTQSSLAQVLYTSGTTGYPKGVMIEHLNIISLVKNTNFIAIESSDRFIQLADTSFDASTLEIWGALLNGCCVVLVKDKMDLFANSKLFQETLEKYSITILWLTRALFDQIYIENKKTFCSLKALIVGGEALNKKLIEELTVSEYAPKHLINGYGPTECTTFSCTLEITKEVLKSAKTVPIGKPIANKSVYVLNEVMSPLPVGAVGELYIGGAGCARGYLNNPALTDKKFVINPFSKSETNDAVLYKTGDLVRWLPDGNLEFIGRNDFQVKLNGYRIELEEIESILSQHPDIKQSAVLIRENKENKNLVAYCVKMLELDEHDTQEFVSTWETLYQSEYDALSPDNFKLNIKGWNSSYTKKPIPAEEMSEWIQETVKRIAEQKPQRILEIGSGSGLVLFNIYDKCDHYIATDFSKSVITYTNKVLESHGLQEKVDTICCLADQIPYAKLETYDTVVVNSVIQYFPHLDYLESVLLEAISHMDDKGRVFIGDIRDYRLLECFHYSVLRFKGGASTKAEVAHFVRREKELLISPEYFVYLKTVNPAITSVEIMPKMGCANHEMNHYRYDVILHIDKRKSSLEGNIRQVEASDFVQTSDIVNSIQSLGESELLLVKYPNKRIIKDYADYYALKIDRNSQLLGIDEIAKLAKEKGYAVKFNLNLSNPLYLNIAFYKSQEIRINHTTDVHRQELANNPLVTSKLVENQFAQKLKEHLSIKLPEYMIPEHYVVMDRFPVTQNGKLDRKALPDVGFINGSEYIAPRNTIESQIQSVWSNILDLSENHVSVKDDFFRLGGNSILAIKLANQLNKHFQQNIQVADIFIHNTIEKLSRHLMSIEEAHHLGETYVF